MTLPLPDTGLRLGDVYQLAQAITMQNQNGYGGSRTALGTTQATAGIINSSHPLLEFITVPSGSGVQLPMSSPGKIQVIANGGSNNLQVYTNVSEPGTPKINATAGATGLSQGNGTTAIYVCMTAGQWYRILSA